MKLWINVKTGEAAITGGGNWRKVADPHEIITHPCVVKCGRKYVEVVIDGWEEYREVEKGE